jgi:hypothetical protein
LKLVFIFVEVFGAVRILFAQLVTTIWIKRVKVKYYIMTVLLHLMDALLLPLTAACYLYGAIPFSYVFTYLASGKRIYEAGSRNIGVANTFVVGGMIAGLLTVCSEISKVVVCIAERGQYYARIRSVGTLASHSDRFLRHDSGRILAA